MNRHRELAQMMRATAPPVGELGPNISHIAFTEGTGIDLADTGDAGLGANGAVYSAGASWSTESGKDILVTDNGGSTTFPAGWHQFNDLDSYLSGADLKFSVCIHISPISVPIDTIGIVFSKYVPSACGLIYNFYLAFQTDGQLRFVFHKGSTTDTSFRLIATTTPPMSYGQWGKLVVTYDGSQDGNNGLDRVKIYLDGVELDTVMANQNGSWPFDMGSDPASPVSSTRFSWGVASNPSSCRRYGQKMKWADCMFFDRVLTPAQAALYAGGF